jgi:chloride channel protein, CIC family
LEAERKKHARMISFMRARYRFIGQLFEGWLERIKVREQFFMMGAAIVIGVLCGFGAVGFRYLVEFMHLVFWGDLHITPEILQHLPPWRLVVMPAVGGLLVGPMVYVMVKEARGHGVPEVMAAVALKDGLIQGRVALVKALSSAITIGSGGSAGPEGPIIQIGAAIGSKVGQVLRVTRKRLRTFVGCGAAAGLAATFNAPIAGSLFAVEVILGEFGMAKFSPIVISAVVATVISRKHLGGESVFNVPEYELASVWELGPYMVLGAMCGLVSILFMRVLYKMEDAFAAMDRAPNYLKPMLGGLMVGAMGWLLPQVYGDGEAIINLILHNQLAWGLLVVLLFAKMAATAFSLGSGGSGGVFAPSLFLGATAGGAMGHLVGMLMGDSAGDPGGYALVAMGGLVAGTTHAPITAILMIFEITNNYQIILPLMMVSIISILISSHFSRESIYTLKLMRQGIDLFRGQSLDVLKRFRVRELMQPGGPSIPADAHLDEIIEKVASAERTQFYVTDQGRLTGVIYLGELSKVLARREGLEQVLLAEDVAHAETPCCKPDDPLSRVLLTFEQAGLAELPVIEDNESRKWLGIIRYKEVVRLYNAEIMKRDTGDTMVSRLAHSGHMPKVKIVEGFSLIDWEPPPSWWGKTLGELNMPLKFNVRVMLVKKRAASAPSAEGQTILPVSPGKNYCVEEGDILILYGPDSDLDRIPTI